MQLMLANGGGASQLTQLTDWPLTTNGDLLTRTAGVPARLAMGSALQGLRVNAGATGLEYATISDSTKVAKAGDTMTGALVLSTGASLNFGTAVGTQPGAGNAYICGISGVILLNSPTNGYFGFSIQDTVQNYLNHKGISFPVAQTVDSSLYQIYRTSTTISLGTPTGGSVNFPINGTDRLSIFLHGVRTGIGDPGNGTVAFTTNGTTRFEYDVNGFIVLVPLSLSNTKGAVTGGSSLPLFGAAAIGGTGQPASAAQSGWLTIKDFTGSTYYFPVWQ